ncbi:MAG: sigma-54 dependent transcriptional regulator [Nitrospirota bacterium]
MNSRRILVVDDDESLRRVTQVQLEDEGYAVMTAPDAREALRVLARRPQDLVLTDLSMPGISGVELLRTIRSEYPDTSVVLVTAFGTVDSAVEAMRLGAYDYIMKPVNPDSLRLVVGKALEHLSLREEVQSLRHALDQKTGFENVVGHSKSLLCVLETAARAAASDVTVLISGETGTGKELVAQGIHRGSARNDKPFVTINCGAIPAELLESELFGHVRGAFTGAANHKKGKIELADCGTVFLDEIGELPLELQVKFLRLLQEHEISKVGSTENQTVNVRIIAATHRDLRAMAADGRFREDLYYRLNVVPIELPPLRERREDIPELVQHFLGRAKEKHSRPNLKLQAPLLSHFSAYPWPGNIRELENVIERLVVLSSGDEVTVEDLPVSLSEQQRPSLDILQMDLPPEGISLECLEKEILLQVLVKFEWNQTHAAQYLGLSRKTLIYRMEKYGLGSERNE